MADELLFPSTETEPPKRGPGQPKKVPDPATLWQWFNEYMLTVDMNPIMKKQVVKGGVLAGTVFDVPTPRPYTWEGFEAWLIHKDIWGGLKHYQANTGGGYNAYRPVIRAIGNVIFSHNFDGAAADIMNPNIIARQLGLVERKEIAQPKIAPIKLIDATRPDKLKT